MRFKGNQYFTKVNQWLEESNFIGANTSVDERTIKKKLVSAIAENPAFISLKEDERYNLLVKKLKGKLDGENECNKY